MSLNGDFCGFMANACFVVDRERVYVGRVVYSMLFLPYS